MISKFKNMLLVFVVFLLMLTGCLAEEKKNNQSLDKVNDRAQKKVFNDINQYDIDVDFNPKEKIIKGNQRVTYINNEEASIDKVYFHLYPNAFKKKETAPFLFDDFINAYPRGFAEGYIDIEEVYIDGKNASYSIGEAGDTIMEVNLPHGLSAGKKISIDMKYTIKLPPASERFGYGNDTFNLGNWYPVAAVYDDSGWNIDPYYPIGDPFYSDISNYSVTIKAPKDFVIASTGNILDSKIIGDVRQWEIEADAFRDFAWVASKKFKILEKEIDETIIKMYFIDDGMLNEDIKNSALKFAENSIGTFNKVFGKYPYKEYCVVQTDFPSGMEYPGIVFIGSQYYDRAFIKYLEILIAHETAHQWWYGVVGNDQIDQAWLDESFASYSEVIYFSENYGRGSGEKYHKSQNQEVFDKANFLDDEVILKNLNNFRDWNEYSLLVYTKGAIFLDDIKNRYGKEVFYKILKIYYNRYKFKIANTDDFLNVCEEVTGEELDSYFEKWLE